MEKDNKANLEFEEILELGKKLFVISKTGTKEHFRHDYGYGTDVWLSYCNTDKKIYITNSCISLEQPYHISLDWRPRENMARNLTNVFSCYFYGNRPIDVEEINQHSFKPGPWMDIINEIYKEIAQKQTA